MFMVDPWHYSLYMLISGISEQFDFDIERQVGERLQRVLMAEDEEEQILPFFCFECYDGQRVAVSIDAIEVVNYLFDRSIRPSPQPKMVMADEDEEVLEITLYFHQRVEPFQRMTEDSEQIDIIFEALATDPFVVHKFLSFTDEDGERVTFNAHHLVLLIAKVHDWQEKADHLS